MKETRVFITGGASGLGRALAERYARAGWKVLIGDIHEERLAETVAAIGAAGGTIAQVVCDVRREAELEAAATWLDTNWGGVDVVVNNAGVAMSGGIAEMPMEDWSWIVDINLLGVVRGCKVFTPRFVAQGHGHFVNISSMAGLIHPPMMAAYCATKAAVVALSESMAVELAPKKVHVSVVCPAFFKTNLMESVRAPDAAFGKTTARLVNNAKRGADDIAELVYQGVGRRDFHILTHPEGRVAWMVKRLAPFGAYRRFMQKSAEVMLARRDRKG